MEGAWIPELQIFDYGVTQFDVDQEQEQNYEPRYKVSKSISYPTKLDIVEPHIVDDNDPVSLIEHAKRMIRKLRPEFELTDIFLEMWDLAFLCPPQLGLLVVWPGHGRSHGELPVRQFRRMLRHPLLLMPTMVLKQSRADKPCVKKRRKKKEALQRTYEENKPPGRRQQKPVFRLVHNYNSGSFHTMSMMHIGQKNQAKSLNKDKQKADQVLPDPAQIQETQDIHGRGNLGPIDQYVQIDQHQDTLPEMAEKEMHDPEDEPIVINKSSTWKAVCVIPESEKSHRFCQYILKIIKSRVDVIQDKKINKSDDKKKVHVINVKDEGEPVKYKFNKVENLMEKRKQLLQMRENRTIKVFNIPLQMENANLKAVFSRYIKLEEDGIMTRLKGVYRQAHITYKDEQSVTRFYTRWSIWAFKDCLSVIPC
ncbi:hypothetical protein C1646_774614 [Rhizophagus diaphanus]|nr:hypothetical protein C1646_774614 [Rhizophagus diaphanus] [Rhizophagus sp. MUCL 43196]